MPVSECLPALTIPTLYAYEIPSKPCEERRNISTQVEKAVLECLKMLGGGARLIGLSDLSSSIKSGEVALNWIVLQQDLIAGRVIRRLCYPSLTMTGCREWVGALRDSLLLLAIPFGMISIYAKQALELGRVTTWVCPLAKEVLLTFRFETRVLLLLREMLVVGEQALATHRDYVRMFIAAGLTASLSLAFLGYGTVAIALGFVSQCLGGCLIAGRFALQWYTEKALGPEARKIEDYAINLRRELADNLARQYQRLCAEINPSSEFKVRFEELHKRLYLAPNEHELSTIANDYCSVLTELHSQNFDVSIGMLEHAETIRGRCRVRSQMMLQRESVAYTVFKAYLDGLSNKAKVSQLSEKVLCLWSKKPSGSYEMWRTIPLLERERTLFSMLESAKIQ